MREQGARIVPGEQLQGRDDQERIEQLEGELVRLRGELGAVDEARRIDTLVLAHCLAANLRQAAVVGHATIALGQDILTAGETESQSLADLIGRLAAELGLTTSNRDVVRELIQRAPRRSS